MNSISMLIAQFNTNSTQVDKQNTLKRSRLEETKEIRHLPTRKFKLNKLTIKKEKLNKLTIRYSLEVLKQVKIDIKDLL